MQNEYRHIILSLTPREKEIINCIIDGLENKQISKKLNIKVCTTQHHVSNCLSKLNAKNRTELAAMFRGLIKIDSIGIPTRANCAKINKIRVKQLANKGYTPNQISEQLEIGKPRIYEIRKELGCPIRPLKKKLKCN